MPEEPVKIFYSYSRKDLDLRNALEDHLSALREAGKISTWHDLELEAGTEWEPAILNKLDTADIILLLVSSNFIASKYCYGTELKRAIARHDAGTARVIPIILRPCDWNQPYVPFSKLNVLPTHATPITKWEDQDEAFTIVAQKIRETVEQLRAEQVAAQEVAEQGKQPSSEYEFEQLKAYADRVNQLIEERASDLSSERGINYTRLRDLLQAGKWKEADRETADRMCEVMGRQTDGWLRVKDIENFPCTDLHTIDRLWVKHSQGRFGFSVQKKIWQDCGSPKMYNQDWTKFGDRVGWRKSGKWVGYSDLTPSLSSPQGNFPSKFSLAVRSDGVAWGGTSFSFLALRLVDCNIY